LRIGRRYSECSPEIEALGLKLIELRQIRARTEIALIRRQPHTRCRVNPGAHPERKASVAGGSFVVVGVAQVVVVRDTTVVNIALPSAAPNSSNGDRQMGRPSARDLRLISSH